MSATASPSRSKPRSVRAAAEREIQAISDLINQAFVVERPIFGGERINPEQVRNLFNRGKFLAAEDADGLAGCVYVEVRGDHGYIGLLSVRPSMQGSGLGRRLMEAAEDYFRKMKCVAAELRVISARTPLPGFYRHLGYVETHTSPLAAEVRPKIACHYIHMAKEF